MNKVIMMGRLTKDPDVRYTQAGKAVAGFSIAVDRRFKSEGQPQADFFNCSAFGKTAEFIEKYLRKGIKIALAGEVQNDNYEKDGVKHYGTKIIVDQVEFAESKRNSSDESERPAQTTQAD
jgi:single-strand DNA-binding protein